MKHDWIGQGMLAEDAKSLARALGKQKILVLIQDKLFIDSSDNDISNGGTITKSALVKIVEEICKKRGIETYGTNTKAQCIETMIKLTSGIAEADDTSKGGTVTGYALLKVYLAMK